MHICLDMFLRNVRSMLRKLRITYGENNIVIFLKMR